MAFAELVLWRRPEKFAFPGAAAVGWGVLLALLLPFGSPIGIKWWAFVGGGGRQGCFCLPLFRSSCGGTAHK